MKDFKLITTELFFKFPDKVRFEVLIGNTKMPKFLYTTDDRTLTLGDVLFGYTKLCRHFKFLPKLSIIAIGQSHE